MADSPAPRILGRLTEFNPQSDNISSYLERLELYFEANAIEDARKVPVLPGRMTPCEVSFRQRGLKINHLPIY